MKQWAVITGAGTGIGAALAKEMSKENINILAIGRRSEPLQKTKFDAINPARIFPLSIDISKPGGIDEILNFIPVNDHVKYLVQNAAVGLPGLLSNIRREDFDYAMAVNVTAPLMLSKGFLSRLNDSRGRILHIGTGVAFNAQLGTTTYGVTKIAFHRLYQQLQVELASTNVSIANLLPGIVDTEGLWEHYRLAKEQNLPHISYFDKAKEEGSIYTAEVAGRFIKFVLTETSQEEYSNEWKINDSSHWSRWK